MNETIYKGENKVKDMETKQVTKKKRDMNFESLRIILMLMIVMLHFNLYGGMLENLPVGSMKYNLFYTLEYICIIAVNCYVMITGYYMINKKTKLQKMVSLILQILFYSVGSYLLVILLGKSEFKFKSFILTVFPISTRAYWFMTAYVGLYILIPFINKMVSKLNNKQYSVLLIISTVLLSILRSIYPINNVFEAAGGYSLIWFIYLYLLAGYIKLYKNDCKIKNIVWIVVYALMVIIQMLIRKSANNVHTDYMNTIVSNSLNYNSIFILIESVAMFMIFKNIKIKSKVINKVVSVVAPLTLGVYLIHESNSLRLILWNDILSPVSFIESKKIIVVAVIDVFAIFTLCCIIEKIRQVLFIAISKLKISKKINNKLNIYMDKYNDMVNLDD